MIQKMLWIALAAFVLLAGNGFAQSGGTVTIDLAALNSAFDRKSNARAKQKQQPNIGN